MSFRFKTPDPDEAQSETACEARALKLLARRGYGSRELVLKLEQRGFEERTIQAVVSRFQERGWLNDAEFARAFADEKLRQGKDGPLRIRARLQARGLDEASTRGALDALEEGTGVDWVERARAQLERLRLPLETRQGRERALRLLETRGFPRSVIRQALLGIAPEAPPEEGSEN
jgi:regulatory protein